jgi:uncharacterized protein DUF5681
MAGRRERLQSGPGSAAATHRFKKGQSGNPGGRSTTSLPALPADALNETVVVTIGGRRRKPTKARGDRHADGRQIGECDLRDQDADRHGGRRRAAGRRRGPAARALPSGRGTDKEVVQQFVARLRRQILQEIKEAKAAELSGRPSRPVLDPFPARGGFVLRIFSEISHQFGATSTPFLTSLFARAPGLLSGRFLVFPCRVSGIPKQ